MFTAYLEVASESNCVKSKTYVASNGNLFVTEAQKAIKRQYKFRFDTDTF